MQNAACFDVFCGCAPADETGAKQLRTWLRSLEKRGSIRFHCNLDIMPGSERKKEIANYLDHAYIILLLISINFIGSDDGEYLCKRAIERHKRGEAFVIPVVYRHTPSWQEDTPLGELQAAPRSGKPILLWDDQDLAFAEVLENFKEVLEHLQQRVAQAPAVRRSDDLEIPESVQSGGNGAVAQSVPSSLESAEQRQLYLQRFTEKLNAADLTSLYVGHDLKNALSAPIQSSLSYISFLEEVYCSKKNCWIITGEPGLGKTTLLYMLGIEHASRVCSGEQSRLPVFIELSGYAEYIRTEQKQADLLSTCAAYLATRSLTDFEGITGEEVERQLKSHGYVLLLDALDEIGEPGLRHKVIENLKVIREKSRCVLLITSRISANTSYDAISGASMKELSPFTREQIEQYLRQYQQHYAALPAAWCDKLLKALPQNHHIQDLLATPLLLNMMADILSQSATERPVPDQYVELCERYITHVIEERPGQRPKDIGAHRPIIDEPHRQRDYFASIAYNLHLYRLPHGSSFDVVDYVRPVASQMSNDEIRKDIDQLVTEVGILQKRPQGKYAFRHATFQEFFVADYLLRKPGNLSDHGVQDMLLTHLSKPSWRQIIIFYYARSSQERALSSEWLLAALLEREDDLFATHTFLAADCLQASGAEAHRHYLRIYQHIKQQYHDTPYYALQDDLFRAIRQLSGRAFLPFLQDELRYADRERRIRAIQALGRLEKEEEKAGAVLLLRSTYEEEVGLRAPVLEACLSLGPDLTLSVLLEWLEDDPLCIIPILSKITTSNEKHWLENIGKALDPCCPRPWMCEAIEQLGAHPSPFVEELFQQWLEDACDQNSRPQLLLLLHAIRFPVRPRLQQKLARRRLIMHPEQDPELFIALVCFAGYQKDEQANEPFFDLLVDQQFASLALAEKSEQLQLELLRAWLAIDSNDTCEYISGYLRETTSPLLWKQVIPLLVERGSEVYFAFLCEQLLVSGTCWPASYEIPLALVQALYHMSKDGALHAVLGEDVRKYILTLFRSDAAGMREAVEASAFLLGRADQCEQETLWRTDARDSPGGSLECLLETLMALDLPSLNDALVRYVLDPLCPESVKEPVKRSSYCTYYTHHPLANRVLAFQLRVALLRSAEKKQSYVLQQLKAALLAAIENERADVQRKAVELACRHLDSTDKEVQARVLQWLQGADRDSDAQTIHLVLLYLDESGSLETITALPRFLYGDNLQLQQTAFKAMRDIVRRHEADISEVMTKLAMGGQLWQ